MTDFLSRLAAQTVHATPVVEPRRPSRHEPTTRDDQAVGLEPEARWVEPFVRGAETGQVPLGTGDRVSPGVPDGPLGGKAEPAPEQPVDGPAAQRPTSAPRMPPRRVANHRVVDVPVSAVEAPSPSATVPSAPRLEPEAHGPVDSGLDLVRSVGRDERWSEAEPNVEREPLMAERVLPVPLTGLAPRADEASKSPDVALPSPPLPQPPEREAVDIGRDDSMVERWQAEVIPSTSPLAIERVPTSPVLSSVPEPVVVATPINGERHPLAEPPTLPEPGPFTLADHPGTIPDVASDPAGPPVVHVTIGRIEVRAAPPEQRVTEPRAETMRAPEPVTPTLSLDDYLERRKAGWG